MRSFECIGILDEIDSITNSSDFLGELFRNLNIKLFLKLHNQLDGIQRIGTKIVSETGLSLDLSGINTEFINDNLSYFLCNF